MKRIGLVGGLMAILLFSSCLSEGEKASIHQNAERYFQQRMDVALDKMAFDNFEEAYPERSRIIEEEYNYKHSLSIAGQKYYEKINNELRVEYGYMSNL